MKCFVRQDRKARPNYMLSTRNIKKNIGQNKKIKYEQEVLCKHKVNIASWIAMLIPNNIAFETNSTIRYKEEHL